MTAKEPCRTIDIAAWSRKKHFKLYSEHAHPYVGLTTRLDITDFYRKCAQHGLAFSSAFLFLTIKAVNSIENFRYRLNKDGSVCLYRQTGCSYTALDKSTELFYFAYVDPLEDPKNFCSEVKKASQKAITDKYLANERRDVFYFSAVPWVDFTQIIQPLFHAPDGYVPIITTGKHTKDGALKTMPVSCLAHHGFVDGLHIGRFFSELASLMETFDFGKGSYES